MQIKSKKNHYQRITQVTRMKRIHEALDLGLKISVIPITKSLELFGDGDLSP